MHNNNWMTLYLLLVPSGLLFLTGIILKFAKKKIAKGFITGGIFPVLPAIFLGGSLYSFYSEMRSKAGTFVVIKNENSSELCEPHKLDSLSLTLKKKGKFHFNYKPCFAETNGGRWKWYDNMVTTRTKFDKINDSLQLWFPSDLNNDTIILGKYQKEYLVFARRKN